MNLLFWKKDKKKEKEEQERKEMEKRIQNTINEISAMINSVLKNQEKDRKDTAEFFKEHISELKAQIEESAEQDLRELALKYAFSFIGTFYKWGGDDPSGFDCSGFTQEVLQAFGLIGRREDLTAERQRDRFLRFRVDNPYKCCLVFWHAPNNSNRIIHVEFCIDSKHSIGASGGGSKTLTVADAVKQNAFIKIRPFRSRRYLWGFVDPFKEISPRR